MDSRLFFLRPRLVFVRFSHRGLFCGSIFSFASGSTELVLLKEPEIVILMERYSCRKRERDRE